MNKLTINQKSMESKYIKWDEIWDNEIFLYKDDENGEYNEYAELINDFIDERNDNSDLELMQEECELLENGNLLFFFGESGGANESDTQGWSRNYIFVFTCEYLFCSVEYSQG